MKTNLFFLALIGLLTITTSVFQACKKENEPTLEETGLILANFLIESQLPSFVNIMFQVSDINGKGIENLVTDNFEVQEDGQAVSPSESAMTIKKKDAVPYQMKTILMLDNSASVGNNINEIKDAAITLVNNIVSQQKIVVYVFSEEAVLLQDFTSDVNTLKTAINTISLGYATTNLYGSVSVGVSRWEDSYSTFGIGQGFMILITDGSDTQGSSTLSNALSNIGNKKVYTVGLGGEQDQNALEQLGTAGYFPLSDYSQLSDKFTEIQNEMSAYANSFYWLYYMSPKRGDKSHTLKLSVKNNSNTLSNAYIEGIFNSEGFYSVQQGVVINEGIDSLDINPGETYNLTATTYLPSNIPKYSWQTSDADIVTIAIDPYNNDNILVNAVGNEGQSTNITVTDEANFLSKSIIVNVKETPFGQFTDSRDGKIYKTVQVGSQKWMAENLNYETSNSWEYSNNFANGNIYGRLYTWDVALTACPDGWHLPSDSEWTILTEFLGGSDVAGGKMKEAGTSHWLSPNTGATNSSGFLALPGGNVAYDGSFSDLGILGCWWSSSYSNNNENYIQSRFLFYDKNNVRHDIVFTTDYDYGVSIRCIKDN